MHIYRAGQQLAKLTEEMCAIIARGNKDRSRAKEYGLMLREITEKYNDFCIALVSGKNGG